MESGGGQLRGGAGGIRGRRENEVGGVGTWKKKDRGEVKKKNVTEKKNRRREDHDGDKDLLVSSH